MANAEGVNTLLNLPADVFVIEPTGAYSRLWIEKLKAAGKDIRLVSASRVKFLMRASGISNKNDKLDSAGIALYGLQHLHSPESFLNPGLKELRDATATRNAITKSNQALKNRIGSRLAYEWPEGCKPWKEACRRWEKGGQPIVKAIAGVDTENTWVKRHINAMTQSIGLGISPATVEIAQQLYRAQESCKAIEEQISVLLAEDYLEPYHRVLDRFLAGQALRATLIPAIYPFDRFLEGGKRQIEYTTGLKGKRSKRDRSEGAFKLSCGMGRVQVQSGDTQKWKAGGSIDCRIAIWQYVKTQIVMCRVSNTKKNPLPQLIKRHHQSDVSPWLNPKIVDAIAQATSTTREVACLRIHYETCGKKGIKREMATGSRFIRMVYKALLREFEGS
jgi:hypothetical protein